MNTSHPTSRFLRQHRRRARGTLLAWSLAVTLAAAAFMGAAHLGWITPTIGWALVPIALAGALLVAWLKRAPRLTAHQLAHKLDARWALRAHLETAVELAGDDSPLARTQRDEATHKLVGRNPPGAFFWFTGLFLVALVLALLSLEGTALALRRLHTPVPPPKLAEVVKPAAAETPASPPAPEFHATIVWKSPDSEIRATAIEEVPLVAVADSKTGFRSLSLEMIVNGDREVSRPLDESSTGAIATPGAHELKPSLYLDELDVKVGDIVSYRLVGELDAPGKTTVTSPMQFIEVRKTQRDSELKGDVSPLAVLLIELKARQLQLLKQNFSLAQLAADAASDPSWNAENTRVATEQGALAKRADELPKLLSAVGAPGPTIAQAKEAQSLMRQAGQEIASKANEPATKTQARALALITDLGKNIEKALSGPTSPVADPFKDKQTFKLVPRSETPAGKLEELAARQQQNNGQLDQGNNGGGDSKTEQDAIVRDAEKIGGASGLDPLTKPALDAAIAAAQEAARQLHQDDAAAARVPAAAAQRAFEEAVAAQEKAGRAAAVANLDLLRRTLNAASRASAAERTRQLTQVRDALRAAATEQQSTGSADAARELSQLAELANTSQPTPERTRDIALAAAQTQVGLMPHDVAVSRAVRLLKRAGQPGSGGASGASALGDVEIAGQEAQWITGDIPTIELARQLTGQADSLQRSRADRGPSPEASENAVKLAAALERGRGARDELVRRFNPADVDPAYRAAVETYFERLSRDARPGPRPPGK